MKHLIISYKSRNSVYTLSKILRQNGINVEIINTPRNIAISCGLSIRTDFKYFAITSNIVKTIKLNDFVGIFIETNNSFTQFERIL